MNDFAPLLHQHNLKVTPQRLAISDIIFSYGHVNVEFLYEQMLQRFDSISLATIYKNINLMLENAFVQEVKIPNAKSVYELTKEHHSHLVCQNCGCVSDITVETHSIINATSKLTPFAIESASVIFSGFCQECTTTKG